MAVGGATANEHFGPYELQWRIGRGGMGVVHHAYDSTHDRYVALKVLDAAVTDDPDLRRRFRREAQIVARLRSPHVIPVHAFGEVAGQLYLDMRLVEGSDLRVLLEAGRLPPERAIRIVEQVAEALDDAHDAGLVHRDVKPSNIVVSRAENGRDFAYLVDFGLATSLDAITTTEGPVSGTAEYMSPERFRGAEAGPSADVYGLACVLYQCLTGVKAFGARTSEEAMYRHLHGAPVGVSELRPELPSAIDDVIARGLAKDPAERYRSAGRFAEAARSALTPTAGEGAGRRLAAKTRAHRRTRRRRRPLVAALATVGLAGATITALLLHQPRPSGADARTLGENSLGRLDPGSGRLLHRVTLGWDAQAVASGDGALWSSNADADSVAKLDPKTGAVLRTVHVGFAPSAIAFGRHFVWVADSGSGTVTRIDPATFETMSVDVGASPAGLAVVGGWVWVTNSADGTVARIDPTSVRVVQVVAVGGSPTGIASDGHDVWVAQSTSNAVVRIEGRTFTALPSIPVGNDPKGIAFFAQAVWVTNNLDGTISRIPVDATAPDTTVRVGPFPTSMAVVGGRLWVVLGGRSAIVDVDPRTGRLVRMVRLGARPASILAAAGSLWVATAIDPGAHLGGRVRLIGEAPPTLDPSYAGPSPLLTSSYDGLVAYRHATGAEASLVVPDLAKRIPVPADFGRAYTFEVRRGVTWSTGSPLSVADVRRGIQRGIASGFSFLPGLVVGADRCRPTQCALPGVSVDAAANTVTFHLTRADPEFLSKLAGFHPAVPAATPLADQGARPIAATGPYRIASFAPGKRVLLVRNRYFHPWSAAAQPAGYPDSLEWTVDPDGDVSREVARVERGSSDWADARGAATVAELRARFGEHVYVTPTLFTSGVALNTTIPPFDRASVRQALSYAIDRRAVAADWRGQVGVTCQTLPPNFPAHRAYCPQRISADDGGWKAPDLLSAMTLVRASHTFGMKVQLWSLAGLTAAQDVVTALKELGYDAHVTWWRTSGDYFRYVADSRHRVQAAMVGMNFDPPVVSGLPTLFGCAARQPASPNNLNDGLYCDPTLDRLMDQARAAQNESAAAGNDAWAKVDRRITDQAAWIPLVNRTSIEVTSRRVHHYQQSPVLGVLYADFCLDS